LLLGTAGLDVRPVGLSGCSGCGGAVGSRSALAALQALLHDAAGMALPPSAAPAQSNVHVADVAAL